MTARALYALPIALAAAGCAIPLRAGPQVATQTTGPASVEGVVEVGMGIGDQHYGASVVYRGSFGVDPGTGRGEMSNLGGADVVLFPDLDAPDAPKLLHFVGLYGGTKQAMGVGQTRHGGVFLLAEYGLGWILSARKRELTWSNGSVVSLTLAPAAGIAFPVDDFDRKTGLYLGATLGVRLDLIGQKF